MAYSIWNMTWHDVFLQKKFCAHIVKQQWSKIQHEFILPIHCSREKIKWNYHCFLRSPNNLNFLHTPARQVFHLGTPKKNPELAWAFADIANRISFQLSHNHNTWTLLNALRIHYKMKYFMPRTQRTKSYLQ